MADEADPEVEVLVKPSGITAENGGGGNLAAAVTVEDVSDTELDELLDRKCMKGSLTLLVRGPISCMHVSFAFP